MFYLILFLLGVFIGGFLVTFFDFGVKIQFITGKSALPENMQDTHRPWNSPR